MINKKFTKRTALICGVLVFVHLALVLLTVTGKLNFLFNDASLRKGKAADFFAVYQAGDNFTRGDSLYHDTEGVSTPYSFPFRYLPFVGYSIGVLANLFTPFTAYYIHVVFYEVLLFINIFLTFKLSKSTKNFLLASLPWLVFSPYLIEVFMGQWSFLLASLLFYTMYGILKTSNLIYSYILAPLIKPNGLILLPFLFVRKKWRVLIIMFLLLSFSTGLYFLVYKDDLKIFLENFVDAWYSTGGNLGFKSLYYLVFIKYLGVPKPRIWFYGITGILLLTNLYFLVKSKRNILNFCLWICLYFFIYMDVWEHHYVLLMPVFALIFSKLKVIFSKANFLLFLASLLVAFPSLFALQFIFVKNAPVEPDQLNSTFVIVYHSIKILGVLLLYLWTAHQLLKEESIRLNTIKSDVNIHLRKLMGNKT